MLVSGRPLLAILLLVIIAAGAVLWLDHSAQWAAGVTIGSATAGLFILWLMYGSASVSGRKRESDDINQITEQRRRELVRGTSLYLRELHYRYSIRLDPAQTSSQRCFSAEVNTVKLGFVPVVITDNTNDREGTGYVAFVHDGKRWRGPGLPCPAGQIEAVRHAAKCVSPLSKEEETRF
jgi:hypothetical protein